MIVSLFFPFFFFSFFFSLSFSYFVFFFLILRFVLPFIFLSSFSCLFLVPVCFHAAPSNYFVLHPHLNFVQLPCPKCVWGTYVCLMSMFMFQVPCFVNCIPMFYAVVIDSKCMCYPSLVYIDWISIPGEWALTKCLFVISLVIWSSTISWLVELFFSFCCCSVFKHVDTTHCCLCLGCANYLFICLHQCDIVTSVHQNSLL